MWLRGFGLIFSFLRLRTLSNTDFEAVLVLMHTFSIFSKKKLRKGVLLFPCPLEAWLLIFISFILKSSFDTYIFYFEKFMDSKVCLHCYSSGIKARLNKLLFFDALFEMDMLTLLILQVKVVSLLVSQNCSFMSFFFVT